MLTPRIIALMGPTASGKTALALKLADYLPIDIISVDSAMIYRGMDIGTAKPTDSVLIRYPHYLIDICDPTTAYSVGDFYRDVYDQIKKTLASKRIPLLVGGTMMYFRALQQGLADLPPANNTIRARLLEAAEKHGWAYLHHQLADIDSISAKRIHPNDKQRIQRALEVYYVSGKSMTDYLKRAKADNNRFDFEWLALFPVERALLHAAIAERFHNMLAQGLIAEVEALLTRKGLSAQLPSMRSVNYRQVLEYLNGKTTYQEMIERAIAATRQLAKRQMTWLRSFPQVHFIANEVEELLRRIEK